MSAADAAGRSLGATRRSFLIFVAALALLAALYLGRAVTGDVFVSTETVWRDVQPWRSLAPPLPVHNENLADPPTVWLPMQALTRSMIRNGETPLYTPESYAGAPWLGNMSSALFSPFTWLFVLLPFAPAFAICAALKWLLAGTGAWLLARRLGAGGGGAALAGLVFAFCGFQVVWISSCLTNVAVFAPWLLLALDRLIERPSCGRTVVAALAAWQVLVGGHPETSLYVGVGAMVFGAMRLSGAERKGRTLLACGSAGLIAALLAAPQWLPFLEYVSHSFGRQLRLQTASLFRPLVEPLSLLGVVVCVGAVAAMRAGFAKWRAEEATARGRALALLALLAAGVALRVTGLRPTLALQLLPDWYGRSLDGGSYGGPLTYCDVTAGFCGAAAFVVALATMVRGGDVRVKALALATLLVGARFFRVPLVSQLLDRIPQLEQTGSTRALAFVALAVALVAGLAWGAVASGDRTLRRLVVAVLALLVGAMAPCESVAAAIDAKSHAKERAWVDGLAGAIDTSPDLLDAGADGHGATLRGFCAADVVALSIVANDREVGRATPTPASDGKGATTWSWRWIGSQRLEEGIVRLRIDEQRDGGATRPLAAWTLDLTRAPQPGATWLASLVALGLLLATPHLRSARARSAALIIVVVGELVLFGVHYNDTTPHARMPAAVEPIPLLQQEFAARGPFRVFPARNAIHPNLHVLFGLEVMRGYDALEPLGYAQLLRFLNRDLVDVPWDMLDFSTLALEPGTTGRSLFDFLGFRYVLSEEQAPAGFVERWRRGTLVLYENPTAFARAFTLQRFMSIAEMQARHADPCASAAWDEPGEGSFAGAARVVSFQRERGTMHATVESEQGTVLVVTENAAGFRATVDGRDEPIRRTHGCFLSVKIPAGRHEVLFRYLPDSVVRGLIGGGIGVLLMSILALLTLRSSPKALWPD